MKNWFISEMVTRNLNPELLSEINRDLESQISQRDQDRDSLELEFTQFKEVTLKEMEIEILQRNEQISMLNGKTTEYYIVRWVLRKLKWL